MNTKSMIVTGAVALLVLVLAIYLDPSIIRGTQPVPDPTVQTVTLSGTYMCLPHADITGPQTDECAFGFQSDQGLYYAVNFGASAQAMQQFQSGQRVTVQGFIVPKEALQTDQWKKYSMLGLLTVTQVIAEPASNAKLDINAVCQGALAAMTFPDAARADVFIQECKEGKHPEVIEQYKANLNLGDGAAL